MREGKIIKLISQVKIKLYTSILEKLDQSSEKARYICWIQFMFREVWFSLPLHFLFSCKCLSISLSKLNSVMKTFPEKHVSDLDIFLIVGWLQRALDDNHNKGWEIIEWLKVYLHSD